MSTEWSMSWWYTGCTPLVNCCGTGPCNIFCCSCDGVCRKSTFLQSVLELPWAKMWLEHFGQFDTDKNGAIDIHELKQKANHGVPAYIRESAFQSIDVIKRRWQDHHRRIWWRCRMSYSGENQMRTSQLILKEPTICIYRTWKIFIATANFLFLMWTLNSFLYSLLM